MLSGLINFIVYEIMQLLCQVPDVKSTEHLWDGVDQETNLDNANINVNMDQYLKGTLVACGIHAMKARACFKSKGGPLQS